MEFEFSREECINLESSLSCEWLETNGLGGYASSTVPGCNTRKHHGLLVSHIPTLDKRIVCLAKMEEAISVSKKVFHLSTNQFPGAFHPTGHKYLERFNGAQYPMSLYRVGDILLRRSVLMVQGEDTVLLRYELLNSDLPITLQLTPLVAFRGNEDLTHENGDFNPAWEAVGTACRLQPYDSLPPLYIDCSMDSDLVKGGEWLYNVEYFWERLRGDAYQEDLYAAGTFELNLRSGNVFIVRVSLHEPTYSLVEQWKDTLNERQAQTNKFRAEPPPIRALKAKASQFLITTDKGALLIIKSYPWGDANLHDAIIASPGLTLACGRQQAMAEILQGIGVAGSACLIDRPPIDTPFWLAWVLKKYLVATDDLRTVHDVLKDALLPSLKAISTGKVDGCTVDADTGLLDLDANMTWMRRVVNGESVTPRAGKPVEINALWCNALSVTKDLCQEAGLEFPQAFNKLITKVNASFTNIFWLAESEYLADVVYADGTKDESIRSNQIIAAAMEYTPLNMGQIRGVVRCVSSNLLTPYGLRTLSPGDQDYIGRCDGPFEERTRAAHRGTVWPWLIGLYCEAALTVAENPREEQTRLKQIFEPLFWNHIGEGCIGSVSEAFNGDPPHDFKCSSACAMSVAEVIRTWNILTKGRDI